MSDRYLLLINGEQNKSIEHIERTLQILSKIYKDTSYKLGDFARNIEKYGYYMFVYTWDMDDCEDGFSLYDCSEELKNNGVLSCIMSEREFREAYPDSNLFDIDFGDGFDINDDYLPSYLILEFYARISELFTTEITDYYYDLLVSYLQDENANVNDLEASSKKITYKLLRDNPEVTRIDTISFLVTMYNVMEIDDKNYILFLIIRYMKSVDTNIFKNTGDYFLFDGKIQLYWVEKVAIFKKVYSKKMKGTWWIIAANRYEPNTPVFACLVHDKDYALELFNLIENIRIPVEWDWLNFEEFVHFASFGVESDIDMTEFEDYYKVLGVSYNSNIEEIKAAYRMNMKLYHPDVSSADNVLEMSKKIVEAYEILSNEKKRREYDKMYRQVNFI